jgi:FRG domain
MPDLPKLVPCADALDYFKKVERMGRRTWIYRGHSKSSQDPANDWRLDSSLSRFLRSHRPSAILPTSWYPREREQLVRFRAAAHLHLSHLPDSKDTLAWLALMQHYGSPTRLLDFTLSPAAALYFALREVGTKTGPFSVHALHIDRIRHYAKQCRSKLPQYASTDLPFNPRVSEYGVGVGKAAVDFIGFFDGSLLNPRQEAQDGLFLVPSRIDMDVELWLTEHCTLTPRAVPYGAPWVEFVFENPEAGYYSLINQLLKVGMTARRLFPGLEGICESLKYSWLDKSTSLAPGEEV